MWRLAFIVIGSLCGALIQHGCSYSSDADTTPDLEHPTIVAITSTAQAGVYGIGASIDIHLQFSENVIVTGSPKLTLNVNQSEHTATYVSGSTTNTLTFSYTVQAGDTTTTGTLTILACDLQGGTIHSAAGNDADITLTDALRTAFLSNSSITIDGIAPTVVSVVSDSQDGTYYAGDDVDLVVTFSESVIITGSPTMLLAMDGEARPAVYVQGSGTQNILFTYTVHPGDITSLLNYVDSTALHLSNASIRDNAGNDSLTALPDPSSPSALAGASHVHIDGRAPTVSQISPSIGQTVGGTSVTITGNHLHEGVVVTLGGIPCTAVNIVSDTSITCITGAATPGTADVTVSDRAQQSASIPNGFRYTSLTMGPGQGHVMGGTMLTISSSDPNLINVHDTTVNIGGNPCTALTEAGTGTFTCITPPSVLHDDVRSEGTVDITVTNTVSGVEDTVPSAFRYVAFSFPVAYQYGNDASTCTIRTFALHNNTLYIGGDFMAMAPYTGSLVPYNVDTLELPTRITWPIVKGTVKAVVADPRDPGAVYIGGSFTIINNVMRPYVARINANGTLDATWTPPAISSTDGNTVVNALAIDNSTLYVGGTFDHVGDQVRNNLAAFNVDPTSSEFGDIMAWDPNIHADYALPGDPVPVGVYSLALTHNGDELYVGGRFNRVGDSDAVRATLAKLNTRAESSGAILDEMWQPIGDLNQDVVFALAFNSDESKVYFGGNVGWTGDDSGVLQSGCDYLSVATTESATMQVSCVEPVNGWVTALFHDAGMLYAGGGFSMLGTINGGADIPHANMAAIDLTVSGSEGRVVNWSPRIAAGDAQGTTINTIVVRNAVVFVGGIFGEVNGDNQVNVAAFPDATTHSGSVDGLPWAPNPGNQFSDQVHALTISGNQLHVGGDFVSISGIMHPDSEQNESTPLGAQLRHNFAAIDITSGEITAWDPQFECSGAFCSVNTMAVSRDGSKLYVGGALDAGYALGGQYRNNIARFNLPTDRVDPDWAPEANGTVNALVLNEDAATPQLYVGGAFSRFSDGSTTIVRKTLAAIDLATGSPTEWAPNSIVNSNKLGSINALVYQQTPSTQDGVLYVAGTFAEVENGSPNAVTGFSSIAAFDYNHTSDTMVLREGFQPQIYVAGGLGTVDNLCFADARSQDTTTPMLIAAGKIDMVGSESHQQFAVIDAVSGDGASLGGEFVPSGDDGANANGVATCAVNDTNNRLYLGGTFRSINTSTPSSNPTTRYHFASLSLPALELQSGDPNIRADNNTTAIHAIHVRGNAVFIGGNYGSAPVGNIIHPMFTVLDGATGIPY